MRSKRIELHDEAKLSQVNEENLKLLQRYKVDMVMRNLSEGTQRHYILDLQQWFIWNLENQGNKSVREMNDDDITEFLYFCKSEGNNSERIKTRIAGISAFFKFLRKKRLIVENPTEFIDRPKRGMPVAVQTFLTPEQVALMREKLIDTQDIQLRLFAMLSLSTMARAQAIASIKWNQIDIEKKCIYGVLEKEGKIVDLYFSDEVKYLLVQLKLLRESRRHSDYGWLFYTGRCTENKHINTSTLNSWCKKIGQLIGVPTLHCHDFRHSGATILKNAGMPLEDVSVLLNHESTQTTKKFYIKEDTARISSLKGRYNI